MTGQADIFGPFLAMALLTLGVWLFMYARRLGFIRASRVDPQSLATDRQATAIIPPEVHLGAENFRNLLELPVLFYALCLYLYVTGSVDALYVAAGWVFFAFRVAHSLIHCTRNIVVLRFSTYILAAAALWFMVVRAALAYWS